MRNTTLTATSSVITEAKMLADNPTKNGYTTEAMETRSKPIGTTILQTALWDDAQMVTTMCTGRAWLPETTGTALTPSAAEDLVMEADADATPPFMDA